MTIWQDSSYYLRGRLQMMIDNASQGLLLVFLVLSLFLRPSLAFFVALGLPFPSWVLCHHGSDWGINQLVSLFAFIVVLGISGR